MQHDEVIWQVIRHHHCSFMAKIETGIFCRNPYNVTGICNRSSCPLANSRYATIRDHDGVFYLYLKTIERAHMPDKLWERVKLPRNYEKALEIIDKHMIYWPKLLVHKIKQRLTKMTQVRIRMRKLALKIRERIMTDPTKTRKQEALREEKALKAARLEDSISKELLERHENRVYPIEEYYKILSKEGTKENIHEIEKIIEKEVLKRLTKGGNGDIVNYPVKEYNKILDKEAIMDCIDESEDEGEPENKYVEGYEDLEEAEDIEDFGGLAMMDDDDVGMDDDDDEEIVAVQHKRWGKNSARNPEKEEPGAKSKKKAKVLVEVEREGTGERQRAVL